MKLLDLLTSRLAIHVKEESAKRGGLYLALKWIYNSFSIFGISHLEGKIFSGEKRFYFIILCILLVLTGCVSSQGEQPGPTVESSIPISLGQEPAIAPSHTTVPSTTLPSSPTEIPTLTASPTPMPSLTQTPSRTPEPSNTPTASPTSTPAGFKPGIYGVGGCAQITLSGNWWVDWCVVNIVVNRNQTMVFNVTWVPYIPGDRPKVTKRSDQNSSNMYLTDNLGNHYTFVALGGYAAQSVVLTNQITYPGAFVFPLPQPGAHTFTFHDSDNGVTIQNLRLDKPTIAIYEFVFQRYGLALEYRDDLWVLQPGEDGKSSLSYKLQENCQIQEAETSEPTGKLKNTIEIGQLTFEIYGKLEDNWGIREYLVVGNPGEYNLNSKPMFLVRVPLENSLQCLNDVSALLYTLRPQDIK